MIEKFKKGGTKKQGSILAQIQQLPKQQQEQVLQAFSQWAEQKGIDINQLQQDQNALEEALGMFMQELQGAQTQKAKQGAKLNYIKTLKNQCAEDEEVVYYKKGGSVGCGCKKKQEGGEIPEDKCGGAVKKFKAACGAKIKKEKCGGKTKKHQLGGIFRTGPLPTAPKVEEAYAGGTYHSETPGRLKRWITGNKEINTVTGPTNVQKRPRVIQQILTVDGDTLYKETPAYDPNAGINVIERTSTSKYPNEEHDILKRRFNDARIVTLPFKTAYKQGGSLNGVPFYQTGTPKGGIVLNNDATYVAPVEAFNPETMYFEPTQESWEDLIPIYGSYREAKKMDENPSFKQGVALGTSVLSDALSLGLANTAVKTLLRGPKYAKILKARGFKPITTDGRTVMETGLKQVPIQAGKYGTIGHKTEPYIIVKQIPNTNPFTTFIKGLRPNGVDVAGATAAGALGWGAGEYEANQKK